MKLGTKYLGMSKLFKYPIKSYRKNLTWCEMPCNILQHIGPLHIRGTRTLSPSFYCFCNTLHTSLLAWPFFLSVVFFLENVIQEVAAHFCLWNDGLKIS